MDLKSITIRLPKVLANDISGKEIVGMVMNKAITMAEYYRSRLKASVKENLKQSSLPLPVFYGRFSLCTY